MNRIFAKYAKIWLAVIAGFAIFLYVIQHRKEAVYLSPARAGVVVAFGDSLAAGTGASAENKSYPAVLATLIGREVVNAGYPGDTTYEALARVDRDVLPLKPAVVLVTLGGNDHLRGIPNETTTRNLGLLVAKLHQAGAMVAFTDIDPPEAGWRFKMIRKQNEEMGVLHIPGVMAGFWGNPELMADRIHPNDAGYKIFAERVAAALKLHLQ